MTVTRSPATGFQKFLKNNLFLLGLILLSPVLTVVLHRPVTELPSYINWKTIYTLAGLLMVTMGIKESGYFHLTAFRLSRKIHNERYLALFLIFLSAFLSTFLTNDIALFIVIPLTIGIQKIQKKDFSKIIIFEALAVNAGSALTPIGNPQNIFLWHMWGISFLSFIRELSLVVLLSMVWLFLFSFFTFPSGKVTYNDDQKINPVNNKLFIISLLLLAGFIFSIEMDFGIWFLPVIFLIYSFFYLRVISHADWMLLFLFLFIFIDIGLICQAPAVSAFLTRLQLHDAHHLYLAGTLGSQVISNVPATVLLSPYTTNYKMLAYAVNIGGNGLFIASFANLIALRFIRNKSKYFYFHFYSVIFFIVTGVTVWLVLIR